MPELEERGAASACGYNWKEWQALPYEERVDNVAYFRIKNFIELNQNDASAKAMERARKKR